MLAVFAAGAFFGCIAFVGAQLSRIVCAGVRPFEDGPPVGTPPVPWLVAGSAMLGALLVGLGAQTLQIGLAALVVLALVAAWCSDAICGLVPDVFTLGPLGAIVLFMGLQHQWGFLLWDLVPVVPFVVAAAFTRGHGLGWGDVKLSAFAGPALGAPLALVALAFACGLAVIAHRAKRMSKDIPIAFAPYIAASIALALPLGVAR
jgi:prepilin signal peptidase PulO-like enzyme (type II secretory pathway)